MIDMMALGDRAILLNFDQRIDATINDEVIALTQKLKQQQLRGVLTFVPAYCSLTLIYDPFQTNYSRLASQIKAVYEEVDSANEQEAPRHMTIPVCYNGPDLAEVADLKELAVDEVIAKHTASSYRVYMIGFLPGFPYMGKLGEELRCSRRPVPRREVPAGSVAIAGLQTGIYPLTAPGGWQLIGQTPIPVFREDPSNPFLFRVGDQVQFRPIEEAEYETIIKQLKADQFDWATIYG